MLSFIDYIRQTENLLNALGLTVTAAAGLAGAVAGLFAIIRKMVSKQPPTLAAQVTRQGGDLPATPPSGRVNYELKYLEMLQAEAAEVPKLEKIIRDLRERLHKAKTRLAEHGIYHDDI